MLDTVLGTLPIRGAGRHVGCSLRVRGAGRRVDQPSTISADGPTRRNRRVRSVCHAPGHLSVSRFPWAHFVLICRLGDSRPRQRSGLGQSRKRRRQTSWCVNRGDKRAAPRAECCCGSLLSFPGRTWGARGQDRGPGLESHGGTSDPPAWLRAAPLPVPQPGVPLRPGRGRRLKAGDELMCGSPSNAGSRARESKGRFLPSPRPPLALLAAGRGSGHGRTEFPQAHQSVFLCLPCEPTVRTAGQSGSRPALAPASPPLPVRPARGLGVSQSLFSSLSHWRQLGPSARSAPTARGAWHDVTEPRDDDVEPAGS